SGDRLGSHHLDAQLLVFRLQLDSTAYTAGPVSESARPIYGPLHSKSSRLKANGRRSGWPAACRGSKAMFWPMIQPRAIGAARTGALAPSSADGTAPRDQPRNGPAAPPTPAASPRGISA